jgi:hypothetical protein
MECIACSQAYLDHIMQQLLGSIIIPDQPQEHKDSPVHAAEVLLQDREM